MITHYFKTLKDSELKVLTEPRIGVWTHVVEPSEMELATLVSEYNLDAAILEDSQDFFEVPRMEQSGNISYFFTRYPYDERDEDSDTAPVLFVMGETAVITIAPREVPQFRGFLTGEINCNTTQKTKLLIQLIGSIMKSYEAELMLLRKAVHRDRTKLRRIGPLGIQRLVNHEHALNNMIAALMPTNMWLSQVTKGNYIQLYAEDMALMEVLLIGSGQLIDSARSVLKTIQNVRSASEAIMTSTLNTTIKTLTIVTILLTIPNVIFSLFGMNVSLPLQDWPYTLGLVLVLVVILIGLALYLFKRNDWL